jgi:hypothetical protein
MRAFANASPLFAAALALGMAACSSGAEERRVAALVSPDAGFETLTVCHGTGCAERSPVRLDENDWSKVDAIFFSPATSAADERARIAVAIGIVEVLVGPQSGTKADTGRNQHSGNRSGQLDCVDEAVNSTTYLRLIADRGLLRYHDVGMPANRIIDLVDAHNTAVVVDRATGIPYAVDSWFFDNGTPAVVLPLVVWRSGWDPLNGDIVPPDPDRPTGTAAQPAGTAGATTAIQPAPGAS